MGNMYNLICLSEGLSKKRLIPKDVDIYEYVSNPDSDYYVSVYLFREDFLRAFEKSKSIAGVKDVMGDQLVFDFDDVESIDAARKDAVVLVDRLIQDGVTEKAIEISFSGGKGFHVIVNLDQLLTPEEMKKLAFAYASDLKTFDKVVYNPTRIIRLLFTKNLKTGLYKIPLTLNELKTLSINDIKKKAMNVDWCDPQVFVKTSLTNKMMSILLDAKTQTKIEKLSLEQPLDLSKKPRWLTAAKYALQEGYFVEGERNNAFLILAATYKAQGFDKEIAYRMLKGVAELQARRNNCKRYPEEELWNNIINVVYSDTWNGGTFSYENTPLLQEVTKRLNLPIETTKEKAIINISEMFSAFKSFAENIDKNTVELGIPEVDSYIRITTSMLVGLLAAPSAGKTSIALNTINNMSKKGIMNIFFSLDMGAPLVYQRLLQKHTRLSNDAIFKVYKENDTQAIEEFENVLQENYLNTLFSFNTALTVDDIRKHILETQTQLSCRIKFICIDYLECLQSPYSDPVAGSAYNAQKLKDLANELDLTVLLLLQPQKNTGDPSSELVSMRNVKGSSAIEQACSVIFTMWRPGFDLKNPDMDKYLSLAVVKNRMGGVRTWDFKWDGLTGSVGELSYSEREELEEIRKAKKEQNTDF